MASFAMTVSLLLVLSSAFVTTVLCFSEESPADRRILVLVEDLAIKSSHSLFFKSLSDRGYKLEFKSAYDPSLALQRYGEYLYGGLILFCPSIDSFGGSLEVASILDFVDSGHDLILAADKTASDLIRELAAECGVDFDDDSNSVVIDHLGHDISKSEADHTLLASDAILESRVVLGGQKIKAPILFQGIAHSVNPANSLVVKVLSASPTAYSANPNADLVGPPTLIGASIGLISIVQARNNARMLISGSLAFFSNRFFRSSVQKFGSSESYTKSGNEQLAVELSKWTFHERGHLKAVNIHHHKIGETSEPSMYRITDQLEYSLEIYEWSGKEWTPYVADDVQVQFYMMSPYVLKTMKHDGKGVFSASFQVPDVYGVFQFKVEYKRLGYSSLSLSKQIPVRPFRHNEYERFITAAYPYYGSAFSMMAGFFIFGIVFLYHK